MTSLYLAMPRRTLDQALAERADRQRKEAAKLPANVPTRAPELAAAYERARLRLLQTDLEF